RALGHLRLRSVGEPLRGHVPRANRLFFSSRRRHTSSKRDWSSDVCSSDLVSLGIRRTLEKMGEERCAYRSTQSKTRPAETRLLNQCGKRTIRSSSSEKSK